MEKHKPCIYNHTQDATHMAAESAAIRHAWQRQSKLLLDEHDSGIEQTAIHDAQVSGKADRYSARIGLRFIELKFQQ